MSLIVQKFGGSSVADAEQLLRSAQVIRDAYEAGHDVVAVVSAQGDCTDRLLQKAQELTDEAPPRELDALLTAGEQVSAALTAVALTSLGVPSVSLCAWQLPIEACGAYGDARIERIERRRIDNALSERRVVVVTGFQGVNGAGDPVTLGRGGSDYSAVALAAALNAARCVIYTDVDGVYTADPRLCPTAKRLDRVCYEDMYALSHAGAQVLHDKCVALAQRSGVEPEVRDRSAGSRGTRICGGGISRGVIGVTHRQRPGEAYASVTVVGGASLALEKQALAALDAAELTVVGLDATQRTLTLFVPQAQSQQVLCVLHDALVE